MRRTAIVGAMASLVAFTSTDVAAQQPLTTVEIKSSVIGNTLSGYNERGWSVDAYYHPDGTLSGRIQGGDGNNYFDGGKWNLSNDGKLCRQWTKWRDGELDCFRVYRMNEKQVRIKAIDRDYEGEYEVQQGDRLRMKDQ